MMKFVLHLYRASQNSWKGLKKAWALELAFRLELLLCLIAVPCAFFLGNSAVELVLLISSILLLPIIELLNSAIEATVDRIGLEYHELSGLAKDLASAAILVAGINAVITWGIIFYYSIQ